MGASSRAVFRAAVSVALTLSIATGCGDDATQGPIQATDLPQALAEAEPGDVIMVQAGAVTGSFSVPAGVALVGAGPELTVFESDNEAPPLTLETATALVTRVSNVQVHSEGSVAVALSGDGEALIEDAHIRVTRGVGLAAADLDKLTLTRVRLSGPVTAENAGDLPPQPNREEVATHGLIALRVVTLQAEDVWTSGFASFGAVVIDSDVQWVGGGASGNLGVGLMVEGGSATLEGAELCGTLRGAGLFAPYSGVFSGAMVNSTDLRVCDGAGVGLLHDSVTGSHVNLNAARNEEAAVWIQNSSALELSGRATTFTDNAFAGVVVVQSENIMVADALIESTRAAGRVVNDDVLEVGDGIQLVDSTVGIDILDVTLQNNSRVGVLADLGGLSTAGITLQSVEVIGQGEQLGVVAQGGELTAGWDDEVTRLEAVAANDAAFIESTRTLDVVGAVSQGDFPAAEQGVTDLLESVGIITPSD